MKKTLLLTAVAIAVASSSCVKDEVVGVNKGSAIEIHTAVETRGLEASYYTLDTFFVTALEQGSDTPYFQDVPFVLVGWDKYNSNPTYYWPGQGRKLSFYAYAPSCEKLGNATVTLNNNEKKIEGLTVKTNIDEQHDFVYAYNEGNDGTGLEEQANVGIVFDHKLSAIDVRAYTSSDYVYNFAGVRIGGIYNKGNLADLAGEEWEIATDAEKVEFEKLFVEEPITMEQYNNERLLGELMNLNNNTRDNFAFMIPQEFAAWDPINDPANDNGGAYIAVYVQINTADGVRVYPSSAEGDYAWVAVPVTADEWQTGYKYMYTLDFTDGAGYTAPTTQNPGVPVLGDAKIKMTMSLNGMEEGVEDMVVNPNMLGEWTAIEYKLETVYYLIDDSNDIVLDENDEPIIVNETTVVLSDVAEIGAKIDNFAKITISDGKRCWIKTPDGQWGQVKFVVNERNYILLECYRRSYAPVDSTDENDYSPATRIHQIIPATPDTEGSAIITLDGWGTTYENGQRCRYEDYMTITYTINYLNTESE